MSEEFIESRGEVIQRYRIDLASTAMVFALDTDDGRLRAFPSADGAAAHCKAVDVEDGYWLFFAGAIIAMLLLVLRASH